LMAAELDRAEQKVEDESAALRKELGLRDLVLTQILFVVGSSWVGTAAKLGHAHLVFWLLAIAFFYIPQAAVVIYLNRLMPLEGGLYQWAKLGFNEFVGFIVAWNLWLLSISVIALGGMFVTTNPFLRARSKLDAKQQMVCFSDKLRARTRSRLEWRARSLPRQMGPQHRRIRHALGLRCADHSAVLRPRSRRPEGISPTANRSARDVDFLLSQHLQQTRGRRLSGFEYVAILAGETRAPARDIGRSVIIASPVIALMFILGTSSVLAFVGNNPIDLIGPVPQTLRLGLHAFPIAGAIASAGIVLMTVRTISSTSVHLTGSSRLPMVAGWDRLLPVWFSRLHPRYKTPINSIIFVGAVTLVIAISSQIGAGIQEAFQLVDNAANVFYGIVYVILFAIPLAGATAVRSSAPLWLRIAAFCGCAVSLLAIGFTIYPIIDVPSRLIFACKIVAASGLANTRGGSHLVSPRWISNVRRGLNRASSGNRGIPWKVTSLPRGPPRTGRGLVAQLSPIQRR
jgi:amino acid transporter